MYLKGRLIMEKTKEISRKEIVGLKITRCIGIISGYLGMFILSFDCMLGDVYNFTPDTAKVLDRTERVLLIVASVSFLIGARLKRKGIHLEENEKDPAKKIEKILEVFSIVYFVIILELKRRCMG